MINIAIDNNTTFGLYQDKPELALIPQDFDDFGILPEEFYYDNDNKKPSFMVDVIDSQIQSLAFVMVDEDSPGQNTIHWLMWDIDPSVKEIDGSNGTVGKNSWHTKNYQGPTPLKRRHHYSFTLYGLKENLNLDPNTDLDEVLLTIRNKAVSNHTITGIVESDGEFAIE